MKMAGGPDELAQLELHERLDKIEESQKRIEAKCDRIITLIDPEGIAGDDKDN